MTNTVSQLTIDDLIAHAGFVRRLAAGLARDSFEADDVAQETLIAAWRRPPRPGPRLRSWFGAVARNVVRQDARAARRREAHEGLAPAPATPVISPEAVVVQMELHRQLAALVMKLAEAYRQVLFLRFYEDRSSVEIAEALGVPTATVRWRLKTALDQLRAALDADDSGAREKWRAALALLLPREEHQRAPAASSRRGLPIAATWRSHWRGMTIAASAMISGIVLWIVFSRPTQEAPSGSSSVGATASSAPVTVSSHRPPTDPASSGPRDLAAGAAAGASCPETTGLADEIRALERELAPLTPLREAYEQSAPNPVAEARLRPLLERETKAESCPFTFECRGLVCSVSELRPARPMRDSCHGLPLRDALGDARDARSRPKTEWQSVKDPATNKLVDKQTTFIRLANLDGTPVPATAQGTAPSPRTIRHRERAALPPDRDASCRADVEKLLLRIRTLESRIDDLLHVEEAFNTSAPNPALTRDFGPRMSKLLAALGTPSDLVIECRGPFCSARPTDPTRPPNVIKWKSCGRDPAGVERCQAAEDDRSWYSALTKAWFQREDVRRFILAPPDPLRAPIRPQELATFYFRVLAVGEPREDEDILAILRRFGEHAHWEEVFPECERKFAGTGDLAIMVRVGATTATESGRVSFSFGGAVVDTSLGKCVVERLESAAASFVLPPLKRQYSAPRLVRFPGSQMYGPRGSGILGDKAPMSRIRPQNGPNRP